MCQKLFFFSHFPKKIGNVFFYPPPPPKQNKKRDHFFRFSKFSLQSSVTFWWQKKHFFVTKKWLNSAVKISKNEKSGPLFGVYPKLPNNCPPPLWKKISWFSRGGGNYSEPRFREKQSNFFGGEKFFPCFHEGGGQLLRGGAIIRQFRVCFLFGGIKNKISKCRICFSIKFTIKNFSKFFFNEFSSKKFSKFFYWWIHCKTTSNIFYCWIHWKKNSTFFRKIQKKNNFVFFFVGFWCFLRLYFWNKQKQFTLFFLSNEVFSPLLVHNKFHFDEFH